MLQATHPYSIVEVNEPWLAACGFRASPPASYLHYAQTLAEVFLGLGFRACRGIYKTYSFFSVLLAENQGFTLIWGRAERPDVIGCSPSLLHGPGTEQAALAAIRHAVMRGDHVIQVRDRHIHA